MYRAEHLDIGRAVAVKVLQIPEGMKARANDVRARFLREAKILGKLEHPNAVQVLDYGQHEGHTFLVMELLRGRTLYDAVRGDGAFDEPTTIRLGQQMLAALGRAHDLGLVHRDLKPSNVMLVPDLAGEEQIKLLDFGVATAFRDDSLADARNLSVTVAGMFVGTPQYAAPEQFMGTANAGSDVYAMGLLLWEMVTGKATVGSTVIALCAEAHMGEQEWALPADVPIGGPLRDVIQRALRKQPEQRYADANAMFADVQALTVPDTVATPAAVAPPTPSSLRFNDRPGDLIAGKYRLGKLLGSGGFSRVLQATHIDMEREVAIKLLDLEGAVASAGGTTAADLKARFGREAKMSSQLKHPNTITVFDFGIDDLGRWYIVMELVNGTNLHAAVRRQGRFDPRRAATIARDCLRSLSEAHHLGFLHRDLKPGNIMLAQDFMGDETVKVLDFGIATVVDLGEGANPQFEAMKATKLGTFVGTPQYAAPEQFLGEPLTPSTDIYMLGLVIWEMLTGLGAVEADTFGECLKTHLAPTPWRFTEAAGVPAGLAQIVYGALEKDAARRYLSAGEMADDLDGWLDGTQSKFAPSPTTEERWQPAMEYAAEAKAKAAAAAPAPAAPPRAAKAEPPTEMGGQGLVGSLGSGDRMTFDPNLDEDFEPEFLKPVAPVQKRDDRRGQRGGLSTVPKFKEAKIELEVIQERKPEGPRGERPVPRGRPEHQDRHHDAPQINWPKFAAIAGLILAGFVVLAVITQEPPPPPINVKDLTKVEPMHLEAFEKSLREPEIPVEHKYSTEGILRALGGAGWQYRRAGDSHALANVHEQGYRITRGPTSMEIRVVTTKTRSVAQQMFEQTNAPVGAVVFENKLVRVFPPQGKHHPDVDNVIRVLREYRDLVATGTKGDR